MPRILNPKNWLAVIIVATTAIVEIIEIIRKRRAQK